MASRVERERTVGIFEECNTRLLSTSREFSVFSGNMMVSGGKRGNNEIYMAIFLNIYRKSLAVFRTGQCNVTEYRESAIPCNE